MTLIHWIDTLDKCILLEEIINLSDFLIFLIHDSGHANLIINSPNQLYCEDHMSGTTLLESLRTQRFRS